VHQLHAGGLLALLGDRLDRGLGQRLGPEQSGRVGDHAFVDVVPDGAAELHRAVEAVADLAEPPVADRGIRVDHGLRG
jgi:hypothetical protein